MASGGDEETGGGGATTTAGGAWSGFEDNENLQAMDDAAFTRAVTRMMASQRKIYSRC
jgi:hypothetical protein